MIKLGRLDSAWTTPTQSTTPSHRKPRQIVSGWTVNDSQMEIAREMGLAGLLIMLVSIYDIEHLVLSNTVPSTSIPHFSEQHRGLSPALSEKMDESKRTLFESPEHPGGHFISENLW